MHRVDAKLKKNEIEQCNSFADKLPFSSAQSTWLFNLPRQNK